MNLPWLICLIPIYGGKKLNRIISGIGFGIMLDDRISVVADVYKKRGTDMIMTKNVSQANGVQTVKINAGKVDNSGVEVGFRPSFHSGQKIGIQLWKLTILIIVINL